MAYLSAKWVGVVTLDNTVDAKKLFHRQICVLFCDSTYFPYGNLIYGRVIQCVIHVIHIVIYEANIYFPSGYGDICLACICWTYMCNNIYVTIYGHVYPYMLNICIRLIKLGRTNVFVIICMSIICQTNRRTVWAYIEICKCVNIFHIWVIRTYMWNMRMSLRKKKSLSHLELYSVLQFCFSLNKQVKKAASRKR